MVDLSACGSLTEHRINKQASLLHDFVSFFQLFLFNVFVRLCYCLDRLMMWEWHKFVVILGMGQRLMDDGINRWMHRGMEGE